MTTKKPQQLGKANVQTTTPEDAKAVINEAIARVEEPEPQGEYSPEEIKEGCHLKTDLPDFTPGFFEIGGKRGSYISFNGHWHKTKKNPNSVDKVVKRTLRIIKEVHETNRRSFKILQDINTKEVAIQLWETNEDGTPILLKKRKEPSPRQSMVMPLDVARGFGLI